MLFHFKLYSQKKKKTFSIRQLLCLCEQLQILVQLQLISLYWFALILTQLAIPTWQWSQTNLKIGNIKLLESPNLKHD